MKVLHLYRTYLPDSQGGIEEAIRQICYSLKLEGVKSRVLTTSVNPSKDPVVLPEVEVVQVKKHLEVASCSMSFDLLSEFKRQAEWADIINVHFPWPFADLIYLLSGVKKPVVITYHSDVVRQRFLNLLYAPLAKLFFKSADRIIATSPNYFATSDNLQAYSEKVSIIPLGINEQAYRGNIKIDEDLDDYVKNRFSRPYFLFVGVLRYYKGLHILLEAAKGLECDIVIAGAGPMEKELKDQAAKNNVDNVHFLGFIDDDTKASLLSHCRAVVFPSHLRSEAFGVTLLEGAMFSRPLISAELGTGTTHVNVHNETGVVVTPGDSRALRSAIQFLITNSGKAAEMGAAARLRYEKLFSGGALSSEYYRLYSEVINEYSAAERASV